jgi:hypothetical protein
MPEPKELYISNLTETLRQSQCYLAIGFGASVFFALVVFAAPVEFKEMKAPIGPVEVLISHNTALALSVAVYWVAGLLATFFISRIDSITLLLRDPDLVIAALMYPSVLTTQPAAGRLGSCFLPPLFVASGMVRIFGTELLGVWRILGMFLWLLPYLQLGWDLRRPVGENVRRKRAEELVLKHGANSGESNEPSVCAVVEPIEDKGYIVKTVTDGVESYYMVGNVGENVRKWPNQSMQRTAPRSDA